MNTNTIKSAIHLKVVLSFVYKSLQIRSTAKVVNEGYLYCIAAKQRKMEGVPILPVQLYECDISQERSLHLTLSLTV